jgi:hypothetical protein
LHQKWKTDFCEVAMNVDSFYQIVSGICFALTGLWWTVVEGRKDWITNQKMRGLAGGVYASFLIPGVMSLGAQIGGDNKIVWRSVFAVAAVVGMFFTTFSNQAKPGSLRAAAGWWCYFMHWCWFSACSLNWLPFLA